VIESPLKTERLNSYDEDYHAKMNNIAGLIERRESNVAPCYVRMGFCYVIDMQYKGKEDQFTDFFFEYSGGQEEFEELCKKLKINIVYG